MTRHHTPVSSWISAVTYTPAGAGQGRLTIEKRDGSDPLVYPSVPSWVVGLLLSGSPGKAYNRLVRGRYELAPVTPSPETVVDLVPALVASLAAMGYRDLARKTHEAMNHEPPPQETACP